MGRHEGPKALISERTPRQTERKEKKERRQKKRRMKKGAEESVRGVKGERRKTVSEGKSRMQGIPRSFKRKRTDGKR